MVGRSPLPSGISRDGEVGNRKKQGKGGEHVRGRSAENGVGGGIHI